MLPRRTTRDRLVPRAKIEQCAGIEPRAGFEPRPTPRPPSQPSSYRRDSTGSTAVTVEMRASVGDNQVNNREDVALVQFLLGPSSPGLAVDGVWGPNTAGAVGAFQNAQFGFSDGRVDPGDITYNRLRGTASTPDNDSFMRITILKAIGAGAGMTGVNPIQTRPTADGLGTVEIWTDEPGVVHIHTHPTFGTWEVRGVILSKYLDLGEEGGALGNPISGERDAPSGGGDRVSYFEHGKITFTAATATATESFV